MANVKVKLHARCLVDHVIRNAGEVVELPELAEDGGPLAAAFGQIIRRADEDAAPTGPSVVEDEEDKEN